MKPKLDLNDPRIQEAIEHYNEIMVQALEAPQRVESAVLPIFLPLKSETKPEQIASGVAVCIGGEYFIFCASHVFDDIGSRELLIGNCVGERLAPLSGERFSSNRGPSGAHGDDPIDASVFHIQAGLTEHIKQISLSLEDLDISRANNSDTVFLAIGFRSKTSRTQGDQATGKRECYPSTEYGEDVYITHNLNREIHLALAYENKILVGGEWQTSPTPKGFSGGAITKVEGVNVQQTIKDNIKPKQLLSAITIEQRKEGGGKPGVLIGTRISVHLEMIRRFLPNLKDLDGFYD